VDLRVQLIGRLESTTAQGKMSAAEIMPEYFAIFWPWLRVVGQGFGPAPQTRP
jgi:hypothetical protein